jgi:hypothetical protein
LNTEPNYRQIAKPAAPSTLDAALELEKLKLMMLVEQQSELRQEQLRALERQLAAKGTALSGGRLMSELDIVFGGFENIIEAAIANRKELAARVPELLTPEHMTAFQSKLDHYADLAVTVLRRSFEKNPSMKMLPAPALETATNRAEMRAGTLKSKVNNQLKAMALERTLGIHREEPQHVTYLNISHSTIANFNLGTVVGDLNASIQNLSSAGNNELADAVRRLSEAISASSELVDKKGMLENLAHVSHEAGLSSEKRKMGPLKATMQSLKSGLSIASELVPLWLKVEEALHGMGIGQQ